MNNLSAYNSRPIEVWLTQSNIQVTCRVVVEDESTDDIEIDSLSMRGAQREITGYLKREGYQPAGRWEESATEGETVRRFRINTTQPMNGARRAGMITNGDEYEEAVLEAAVTWVRSRGGPDDRRERAFSDLEEAARSLAVIYDERRWGDDT